MRVTSSGGVDVAVHDLGGRGPTLLVSHATGFHGRCYEPMAAALSDRFHCVAFDYRGHGDTPMPDEPVDWERYADDVEAMGASFGEPVAAFGHSMGGACLLIAAHRRPELFSRLVLFEPIVFPLTSPHPPGDETPLAAGARRRRATFASYEVAIDHFAAKAPLATFTPAALAAYVRHGFALGDDGAVHLKCRPETEAATFQMGGRHATWDVLPEIRTPVLVVSGRVSEMQPSFIAAAVADRLPNGAYLQSDEFDHFAPMTHPDEIAAVISGFAG